MSTIPVTVVIPVRNEARALPACLARLAGVRQVVVVDSSSSDETAAVARESGATVVNFVWDGKYPKKRNWMLDTFRFETDWVLFLDADELVTPAFLAEMADAVRRTDMVGFWVNYTNHFLGRPLRHGIRQRKLALFRIGSGRYEHIAEERWTALDMEVHEHPVLAGAAGEIVAPIDHLDDRGLHHFIRRHNDYSTWEANRIALLAGNSASAAGFTRNQALKYRGIRSGLFPLAFFLYAYVVKGGFLDGRAGLAHALLKSVYYYEIALKLREMRASSSTKDPPSGL